MFANRLRKTDKHLRPWAKREQVTCFRLYDRDIPEVPLAVDRYEDHLHVAQYAAEHKAHTEAPGWLDAMVEAAGAALDVPPARVHLKRRERQREGRQYERFDTTGARFVAHEGGRKLWVNLDDYLDTGLFLDHRPLRLHVGASAAGQRFLNLFCYTAAFTVHAAAGGARSSTSVDLSNTYLDWARDNLALNGMDRPEHRLVRADVRLFLDDAYRRGEAYDVVVIDPPTFSRSKKTEVDLDLQRDHVALLQAVLRVVRPQGVVWFSTNNRRFRLDDAAFAGAAAEDVSEWSIPPDFRDRRIHRCWKLVKAVT
jgi:23S rRNA G2069 N7-methylase RlmK/C1962 C5-methylase RlmI